MNEKNKNDVRRKHRNDGDVEKIVKRLNIIEGQVRGIKQMVFDDRYCGDILIQVSAVNKALRSLEEELLKNHLATCVVSDIKNDKLESIDELFNLIKRLK